VFQTRLSPSVHPWHLLFCHCLIPF